MSTGSAGPGVQASTGLAFSFVVGREVYKLKEIQRYCKTKIIAKPIPSLNDVASTKADMIFKNLGRHDHSVRICPPMHLHD